MAAVLRAATVGVMGGKMAAMLGGEDGGRVGTMAAVLWGGTWRLCWGSHLGSGRGM